MHIDIVYTDGSVFSQTFDARPGVEIMNYTAIKEVNLNQYRFYPYDNEAKMIELHNEVDRLRKMVDVLLNKRGGV